MPLQPPTISNTPFDVPLLTIYHLYAMTFQNILAILLHSFLSAFVHFNPRLHQKLLSDISSVSKAKAFQSLFILVQVLDFSSSGKKIESTQSKA